MDVIVEFAEGFIGLFKAGAETLVGNITGILPLLAVIITVLNALMALIGEERVAKISKYAGKSVLIRYSLLPIVFTFTMGSPTNFAMGKLLDEKYKPAYCDSLTGMGHPFTVLFPHTNPAELFVFLGVAQGITKLGLGTTELAVRYLLAGILLGLCRGIITEKVYKMMLNRKRKALHNGE